MKKLVLLVLALVVFSSFTDAPFKNEGKNVIFKVDNLDMSTVDIFIIDDLGRVIYNESLADKEINKLFIFEDTYPGTYTIKVEDGDVTYSKVVKI